jgi:integrase
VTKPRRRQAGEGGISEYTTKSGPRYLIKYHFTREDGSAAVALKRGYSTRKAAGEALREQFGNVDRGTHVAPNRVTVGEHMTAWLDGLRKNPQQWPVTARTSACTSRRTSARYASNSSQGPGSQSCITCSKRQAVSTARVGSPHAPSATCTPPFTPDSARPSVMGSSRSIRQTRPDPPSAKSAASPEMHFWTADELRAFLDQRTQAKDELLIAWSLLVATGMRRGEALGLRWGDVDFDGSRLSVRRSATVVKHKGAGEEIIIGPPKSGKARTVDLDPQTLATLKAHKTAQGTLALALARDNTYVLAGVDGSVRHPERFSRRFVAAVVATRKAVGDDKLSKMRLHDLRHTHATLLLAAGITVKVVSERLGHANAMITLGIYAHVMPGMQAEAAAKFGALLSGVCE